MAISRRVGGPATASPEELKVSCEELSICGLEIENLQALVGELAAKIEVKK